MRLRPRQRKRSRLAWLFEPVSLPRPWLKDAAPMPARLKAEIRRRYVDFVAQNAGRAIPLSDQLGFRAELLDELMPSPDEVRRLAAQRGFDRVYYRDVLHVPVGIQDLVARRLGLTSIHALDGGGRLTPLFKKRLRRVSGKLQWAQLIAADPERLARFAGAASPEPRQIVPHLVEALVRLRLLDLLKQAEIAVARHNLYLPLDSPFALERAWVASPAKLLAEAESGWRDFVTPR